MFFFFFHSRQLSFTVRTSQVRFRNDNLFGSRYRKNPAAQCALAARSNRWQFYISPTSTSRALAPPGFSLLLPLRFDPASALSAENSDRELALACLNEGNR